MGEDQVAMKEFHVQCYAYANLCLKGRYKYVSQADREDLLQIAAALGKT